MKATVIFMLVLVFTAGIEEAESDFCKSIEHLEDCVDASCVPLCVYEHKSQARGACVGPSQCECTYPC
ncbi:hypothetical protein V6N13_014576 [Hibiscus sabdariffa]|uniref:Uncharacterized protein n=1 Tax=Hibiscus sabdariffa TaxID=183260 RepID=A0ABR2RW23_9ROSI